MSATVAQAIVSDRGRVSGDLRIIYVHNVTIERERHLLFLFPLLPYSFN